MNVSLSIDGIEGLTQMRAFLDPKGVRKALAFGMRYASRAATTEAAKRIRTRYTITSGRVKQDIAGPFLVNDNQEARIVFSNRPPSAIQYAGRDNGKGLTVAAIRGQRKRVSRGFIIKSGRLAGRPFKRRSNKAMPIDFVYGPSIGRIFGGQSEFGQEIRDATAVRINEQFAKGVERKLGEAARRRNR